MSLTSAVSTSAGGLNALTTWSEITSGNIANATTPGYVRKDAVLTSTSPASGGGVQVSEIRREVDSSLDRMYRQASSAMAAQQTISDGIGEYTSILGNPGDPNSPEQLVNSLQIRLETLANSPGNSAAQRAVVDDANALARALNGANTTISQINGEATTEITHSVSDLNDQLYQVADLNRQILNQVPGSAAAAGLNDQMSRLVEKISSVMDVQVTQGSDGRTSLYTAGGTTLVSGSTVSDLRYDTASGKLFAGSNEITPNSGSARGFDNGSLAGLFALKNDVMPRFQLQIDTLAGQLVQGFSAQDATLAPGQPGLFTDAGSGFDPASLTGLAGRLAVNAAVDPAKGGQPALLRDGIGSSTPRASGDGTAVTALLEAFTQPVATTPASGLPSGTTLFQYAANMVGAQHLEGSRAQSQMAASKTTAETVDSSRQSVQGVNIDDEMQKLLVIQHSYAANSKMLTTVMSMFDTLLQAV